ncbi:MAG TPA: hypothetical protein VHE35_36570 [Kofleriaceae bacterium]|nr:hypothetical protein [Kofleriaceae bacterium]
MWGAVVAAAAAAALAIVAAAAPGVAQAQPHKPAPGTGTGTGTGSGTAAAGPKAGAGDKVEGDDAAAKAAGIKGKPKVFDFTGLDLAGRLRTPQLLYFLDRASEELERASLERRSFIPAMVRSIDENNL